MRRAPYLKSMLQLKVGEGVYLFPDDDDSLEALWNRTKQQSKRYRKTGRWFHITKKNDCVSVMRVEEGKHKKLSPLLSLKLGERIYYSDTFSEKDYANIYAKLVYYMKKDRGFVLERCDHDGKYYIRCHYCGGDDFWAATLRQKKEAMPRYKVICSPYGQGLIPY